MKIYRRTVHAWSNAEQRYVLVEADTEEYDGPIAEAKGGSSITVPGPTGSEIALQQQQTALLAQQQEIIQQSLQQQNLLAPYMYEQLGLTPTYSTESVPVEQNRTNFDSAAYLAKYPDVAQAGVDPYNHYLQYGQNEGRTYTTSAQPGTRQVITGFNNAPLTPEQIKAKEQQGLLGDLNLQLTQSALTNAQQQAQLAPGNLEIQQLQQQLLKAQLEGNPLAKEIEQKLNQRTLDALNGNLPVDPALERNLSEGKQTLQESLAKQLGNGFATSTPGIQALATFDQRAEELRMQARTGQLTLAEQLGQGRAGLGIQQLQNAGNLNAGSQQQYAQTLQNMLGPATLQGQQRAQQLASMGGIAGMNMGGAQALGQVAQGYNSPLSSMLAQRQMITQAQLGSAGGGGGGSGIAQGAIGGATAGASLGPWGALFGAVAGGALGAYGSR